MRLACALLALVATAGAQHANPASNDGQAIYRLNCAPCHGERGEGGRDAPSLTHTTLSEAEIVRTVSDGVPNSEMASFAARLSTEEIRLVAEFIRSVGGATAALPGDSARGQAIFWTTGGCSNCHAVGNRGNRVGPDLTRIGRHRTATYLKESLISPSADIVRGYEGVTVVTNDGKTIRGIARAVDDFSVVLQDFTGRVYSFDRKDVAKVTRDRTSLMPPFNSAGLDDVVAYLASLRGVQ